MAVGPATLAERRNPLLALPSDRSLSLYCLDAATRELFAGLLLEQRADARRADFSWRRHKAAMAAYRAAVAVYAGHLARGLRQERRREGKAQPRWSPP